MLSSACNPERRHKNHRPTVKIHTHCDETHSFEIDTDCSGLHLPIDAAEVQRSRIVVVENETYRLLSASQASMDRSGQR